MVCLLLLLDDGLNRLFSDNVLSVEFSSDVVMLSSLSLYPVLLYPVMVVSVLTGFLEITEVIRGENISFVEVISESEVVKRSQ